LEVEIDVERRGAAGFGWAKERGFMTGRHDLIDGEWANIAPLLPNKAAGSGAGG
jgi:hypothetical protein